MAVAPATPETPPAPPTPDEIAAEQAAAEAAVAAADAATAGAPATSETPPSFDISAAAEKAARKAGLDVAALVASGELVGTGKDGSITAPDVAAFIKAASTAALDTNGDGRLDASEKGTRVFALAEETGPGGKMVVIGGATRLLLPRTRYRLPASDAVVKSLLASGTLVPA